MNSAPIPILTFSPNPNSYYTSYNNTLMMAVSNAQIGIAFTLQTISLLLIANLLVFSPIFARLSVNLSSVMKLYLFLHAFLLAIGIPTFVQKALGLFDPRTHFYLVVCIYIIGGPYNYIQPYLNMILTLERIFVIRFPLIFMRYRRHYVCGSAVLSIFVYSLNLIWYFLEWPIDQANALIPPLVNTSPHFQYIPQTYLKLFYGGLDLLCTAFFLYSLNKEMGKRIKNRLVKFTAFCELFLEVLPAFIVQIANTWNLIPTQLKLFVGLFSTLFATLNLLLCLLYYNWIFLWVAPRLQGAVINSSEYMKTIIVRSAVIGVTNPIIPKQH